MQPDVIEVPEDLDLVGPYLHRQADSIQGDLKELKDRLEPLAGTWKGAAADLYQEKQMMWHTAAEGLFGQTGVLAQIGMAMNVTVQNYDEAELNNIRNWSH